MGGRGQVKCWEVYTTPAGSLSVSKKDQIQTLRSKTCLQTRSQLKGGKQLDKEASRNPELELILLKLQCTEGIYFISLFTHNSMKCAQGQHHLDLLPHRYE